MGPTNLPEPTHWDPSGLNDARATGKDLSLSDRPETTVVQARHVEPETEPRGRACLLWLFSPFFLPTKGALPSQALLLVSTCVSSDDAHSQALEGPLLEQLRNTKSRDRV